uniref:Photosystem II 22 kDa proteinic n=1 Tax=Rhizophora mucronata TaxID=61149 RepID=A0A2P2JIX3_RHIMU
MLYLAEPFSPQTARLPL